MAFHVGQLVECVDASEGPRPRGYEWTGNSALDRGRIYTVREFIAEVGDGGPGVRLSEQRFGVRLEGSEVEWDDWWFAAERFRPLSESRLEVFRSLLQPPPVERDVEEVG